MYDVVGVDSPTITANNAAKIAAAASALTAKNNAAIAWGLASSPLSGDLFDIKEATALASTAADAAVTSAAAITSKTRKLITGSSSDVLLVIEKLDAAINKVSNERSVLGASQSRFESAISYLQISTENQTAARSRIMDADFAQETANLSRAQILSQAGSAMLAQANQLPQSVMALLRG